MKKDHIYIRDFTTEAGYTFKDLRLAYHYAGEINASGDNVRIVCHAFSANSDVSDWWHILYGKDNIFDPEKHFIVCPNIIGSPYGSTCATDIDRDTGEIYGRDFPLITVRDMARVYQYLWDYFDIKTINMLIGASFGGHQAQEIAFLRDEPINELVLIATSARETAWSIALHEAQRMALEADPTFYSKDPLGGAEGLRAARGMAMLNYRTIESYIAQQTDEDLEKLENLKAASYIRYQGKKMAERFSAHCYYALNKSLDTANIGRGRRGTEEALSKLAWKTKCVGINSDLLIPPSEVRKIHRYLSNSQYYEIESAYGHDGFLIEGVQLREILEN